MFEKSFLLVLSICFLFGWTTKAEEATTTESVVSAEIPEIQLATIKENVFDEEIVNVILDTVTVSISEATAMGWKNIFAFERNKGKVKINYPRIGIKPKDRSRYTALVVLLGSHLDT